jgi:hypothetical protein
MANNVTIFAPYPSASNVRIGNPSPVGRSNADTLGAYALSMEESAAPFFLYDRSVSGGGLWLTQDQLESRTGLKLPFLASPWGRTIAKGTNAQEVVNGSYGRAVNASTVPGMVSFFDSYPVGIAQLQNQTSPEGLEQRTRKAGWIRRLQEGVRP